jgi:hypothetical protein
VQNSNTLAVTSESFDTATYQQTGGTNTTQVLTMGVSSFDSSVYNICGGTFTTSATFILGMAGTAEFNQSVGTTSVGTVSVGEMVIGDAATSVATLALGGGTFIASEATIGGNGSGYFQQTAGVASFSAPVLVGGGGYGQCDVLGGSFWAPFGMILGGGSGSAGLVIGGSGGGGQVTTGTIALGSAATSAAIVQQQGGTLNADKILLGLGGGTSTYIQTGGAASASLAQIAGSQSDWQMDGGALTAATLQISSTGHMQIYPGATVTVGTLAMDATAVLDLSGGLLDVGTFSPIGLATPSMEFSAGTFDFTGSNLTLNAQSIFGTSLDLKPGMALSAAGTLTVPSGELVQIEGGTLAAGTLGGGVLFNSGTFRLTGGGLQIESGAASNSLGNTVVLSSGMQIDVPNTLATSTIVAGGYLGLAGGSFTTTGALDNSGWVVLSNPASLLSASNLINSGTISGTGMVLAAISNQAAGTIVIGPADNLQLDSVNNSGSILLQGGNLGAGSIINQSGGRLYGHGTVQTTDGITNSGTLLFNQQVSEVSGPLTNEATGRTIITGDSLLTLDDAVTNITGSQFDVTTGGTAVFVGQVSGVAAFTGGGVKDFLGTVTSAQPIVTTGTSIVESGANMSVAAVREPTLEVYGNASFNAGGGTLGTGSVSSLLVANTQGGQLDLNDHGMVIEYGSGPSPIGDLAFVYNAGHRNYPSGSIQALLQSGIDNLNWNGPGIMSNLAADDPSGLTAVGAADENDLGIYPADYTVPDGGSGTWLGQKITDTNNVLIRYTLYGDGNLDGVVNRFDVTALVQGYTGLAGYIGWSDGDYTYTGSISKIDVGLLVNSYIFQGAPLGNAITAGQAQYLMSLDPKMPANVMADFRSITGVPEPAAVGLLGVAGVGLAAKRRGARA